MLLYKCHEPRNDIRGTYWARFMMSEPISPGAKYV